MLMERGGGRCMHAFESMHVVRGGWKGGRKGG